MIPGLVLMGLAVAAGLIGLLYIAGAFDNYPYLFLLPWIIGLAVVMAAPLVYLYAKGRLSIADPLVFATLSYFFPAFVLGGMFFAGGWSEPAFLALIQDLEYTVPLTVVIVALGHAGLAAGYFSPMGRRFGGYIRRKLPTADYASSALLVPSILLFLVGVLALLSAYNIGRLGYQVVTKVASYDGLIILAAAFFLQATVLLWLMVFREKKIRFEHWPVIGLVAVTSLANALFTGSRAGILQICSVILLAFVLSGRKFKLLHTVITCVVISAAVVLGMIYGSTFRNVKGTEEQQTMDLYASNILRTFDEVGSRDISETLTFSFENITQRLDVLSTLSVVVSNYERLAPYEEVYGINDNILQDSTTFFIPRFIWENKQVASDARRYSELYFDFGGSSFAITPMGDLLRNFGIIGVPIGMFILGMILRFVYATLVENQAPVIWRLNLYFMLIAPVSYEAFFATIIPGMIRTGIFAVIGVLFVCLVASRLQPARRQPADIEAT